MDQQQEQPSTSTSRLDDVSGLTEILFSASNAPLEPLKNPASRQYLSNLTTFTLDRLTGEPSLLQTQAHHLTSSLTTLTHTSYPTFLSLHHTTNALTTSLTSLSSSLDSLLNASIPALEECAANWRERTETVLKDRNKARTVLEQHEKIRDLLEIPLLIDTCARNGYFSEALSLVSHVKSLSLTVSSADESMPQILSSVLAEVHHSVVQMLLSLLSTLYEPNRPLPALSKAVTFLRKMDIFGPSSPLLSPPSYPNAATSLAYESDKIFDFIGVEITNEEQIALAFLLGRESCLKSSLEASRSDVLRMTRNSELDDREKDDLARYLKKYIDIWRPFVFQIITQYSTIFLEKSATSGSSTKQSSQPSNTRSSQTEQESSRLHSLITAYASRTLMAHLIPVLSPSLPLLSLPNLSSLLSQLSYCSTSLARVGMDFRDIISVLFSDAVVSVVSRDLKAASEKFSNRFKVSIVSTSSKSAAEKPSKWLIVPSLVASPPSPTTLTPSSPTSVTSNPPHIPPQILASYPPLAELTNTILEVLNTLRLLAPTSILQLLVNVMDDDLLVKSSVSLLAYTRAFSSESPPCADMTELDRKVVSGTADTYFEVFVPYIRRALVEGVYSSSLSSVVRSQRLNVVLDEWEEFKRQQGEAT